MKKAVILRIISVVAFMTLLVVPLLFTDIMGGSYSEKEQRKLASLCVAPDHVERAKYGDSSDDMKGLIYCFRCDMGETERASLAHG